MKKLLSLITAIGVGTLSLSILSISLPNKEIHAYSTSSLPTTIDLNATSNTEIRDYFSSAEGLNGFELLGELKNIISYRQKYYSYDSGNSIWQIYEISDRDWVKSPASEITQGTYNPSTNTITKYSYGSNSSHPDNPYLHTLYVDRSVDNPMQAWGNHQQTLNGINREHIWPKSHGFDTEGSGGARGDLMHLWPSDGATNNLHSNYDYGYVDKSKSPKTVTDKIPYSTSNYLGTSETLGYGTVFEPQDSDKGDIARACFYMVARYNNVMGEDDSCDTNNPNLLLNNSINSETGTSTSTTPFYLGVLDDLLEWNRLDPPDEFEIHRNDLLYTNYTNNRNPFIDFPSWADLIWGEETEEVASPKNDAIHSFDKKSLVISKEDISLVEGESTSIYATCSDEVDISWSTSNEGVCSISSNTSKSGSSNAITLTAIAEGNATITASVSIDEVIYASTCAVTVSSTPQNEDELSAYTWSSSFLNEIDPSYLESSADLEKLSSLWEKENTSFLALNETAKSYIKEPSKVTNEEYRLTITNAKERYLSIIDKYDTLNDFIGITNPETDNKPLIVAASIAGFVLLVVVSLFSIAFKKKRRKKRKR